MTEVFLLNSPPLAGPAGPAFYTFALPLVAAAQTVRKQRGRLE